MKQKIINRERWSDRHCRPNEGSVTLTLECGHKINKKQSQEPKSYCLCEECGEEVDKVKKQIDKVSRKIVDEIIYDIKDRSGFDLGDIDEETKKEMMNTLKNIVKKNIKELIK